MAIPEIEVPASVVAMTEDSHAPTAPLADFLAAYMADDNWWWRIACGHHENLFDAAIEQLELARALLGEREEVEGPQ